MISLPIYVRPEFKEKVKSFCSSNNIKWSTVYSESWMGGVTGTPDQVRSVENYIVELELERIERSKKSGFWKEFYNSRLGQYLFYGILYLSLWAFAGFELATLMCLTTILGEIQFQYMNRK